MRKIRRQRDASLTHRAAAISNIQIRTLPFIKLSDVVFDDHATRVMGEAFDEACKTLHSAGQPFVIFETIAVRIIAAASKGERDPDRLCEAALTGFRYESKAG